MNAFNEINETIKLNNINKKSLNKYLFYIYDDLNNRIEKKTKKSNEGLSKESIKLFFKFPSLLSNRIYYSLFECNYNINKSEFIYKINTLYCGTFKEKLNIYFKIFDLDKTDTICYEDIKLILYYFHLLNNSSQNFGLLDKIIDNIIKKDTVLSYKEWENINVNINSDIFYLLNYYFYINKPFSDIVLNEFFKVKKDSIYKSENYNLILSENLNDYFLNINNKKNEDDEKNDKEDFDLLKTKQNEGCLCDDDYLYNINNKNLIEINLGKNFKNNRSKSQSSKHLEYINNDSFCNNINLVNNYKDLNELLTETSSTTRCEEEENNSSNILLNLKFAKAYLKISKKELKEVLIDIIDKVLVVFDNNIVTHLIDLRYSFIEESIASFHYNDKNFNQIQIGVTLSNSHDNFFTILFDDQKNFDNISYKINSVTSNSGNNFEAEYELKEIIGKGNYGEVYKTIKKSSDEVFAVKIINKNELLLDEKLRLFEEINILNLLKHLEHPNILKSYEIYENKDVIYCVTEYLSGTLNEYISNHKLTVKTIKNIGNQIIKALTFLHNLCLVHRDLKLNNIMYKIEDKKINLKIIDFGFSVILTKNQNCDDGFGTLQYMAPEIINREEYNYKIDIWSFGIILYYLRYNKYPFDDSENRTSVICENIKRGRFRWLLNSSCNFSKEDDENYKNVLYKCLTVKYEKRINIEDLNNEPFFKL